MTPDQASAHYSGTAGEAYFAYQVELAQRIAALDAAKFKGYVGEDDCVLDFGCGSGLMLSHLRCRRRLGVDANRAARSYASARGIECTESLGEIASESVDVVISNHCLEHVPAPIEALREIRRVLRPGGRLVLYVPIDDWRNYLEYDAGEIDHHLYAWTSQHLGNCLVEAGFSVGRASLKVDTHALPPRADVLANLLPEVVFGWVCGLFAIVRRRRQIRAVVEKD